jgi:hypothetical protein
MPLTPIAAGDGQHLLRVLVNIASFIAAVVVIACLYWGRTVLIPVAMALLLAFFRTLAIPGRRSAARSRTGR